MKKIFLIKIVIVFLLFVMIFISSFKLGKKFYFLKNTLQNNMKVNAKATIMRWNFNVKFIVGKEVFEIE